MDILNGLRIWGLKVSLESLNSYLFYKMCTLVFFANYTFLCSSIKWELPN